ncbi:parathyroid hormone/parathyroid hormone-related peptide receptor-like isoform X2 [Zootermopsis nevadensis]|uniref:Parathyroid hormone/parathyroid hormone-related peptide receptor n=2 Tax=Zootermopsis nevadensis TaxID=136037 RepID=A0A067QYB9_ZOONE|nr:parathyroid hormone/parathyroid hormone-related peptide receptor-like isoform X2 [Zootermopsis nevadensis]KDR09908.1 Parathyroid hormone/parathyroid hormone-related peptide receptor [Zootermopsis nevadensis]
MWDGVMCWKPAAPGTIVTQSCPDYVIRFVSEGAAVRQCSDNGSWSLDNGNGCTPQQNATHVVRIGPIEDSVLLKRWMPVLKIVSQVGYSVSMVTLAIAFFILSTVKKLRCPRNMLHLHLFLSFIMRAFITLLIDILFVKGVGLSKDVEVDEGGLVDFKTDRNNWECKALTSISNYCIMANYFWILMEGLYLHNLIFLALSSDTSAIILYVVLGWGLPVLFVVLWVVARLKLEDTMCWTTHDNQHVFLLIRLPVITSVLLSFALFVNIVRVLLVKMKSNVCLQRRKWRYRRWAKSTLVLVPLFGVHYVLFIWMSPSQQVNETLEIVCLFCDQLFASLQGFFVSLLYCLLNSEVRAEVVRKWRSYRHKNEQPKRGSAQSLPLGLHSTFTVSRMYNGGRGRLESLSTASGVVAPQTFGQDIISAVP